MSGRHRGLPTGNAQLYKKSKGGAGGPRATEQSTSKAEEKSALRISCSRFFFSFFHAYNTPRKYGANRSSGGGGGGAVKVAGVEVGLWGGAKESSRKRYLSCECTYGGMGEGELVMFGGERERADEPAVIFARGARRRDQRSLLQSRGAAMCGTTMHSAGDLMW